MGNFKETAAELIKSHDDFLSAKEMTSDGVEQSRAVALASCFAAAAYDRRHEHEAIDVLGRVFLLALVDPAHPDLDYLRADPKSGEIARLARADLQTLVEPKEGQSDG